MERISRDLPESPARRVARIARVGARYGFGFVFRSRLLPGRRREEPGRVGTRLRYSLEDLGPTFAELGRFHLLDLEPALQSKPVELVLPAGVEQRER